MIDLLIVCFSTFVLGFVIGWMIDGYIKHRKIK
jgi:hypothetical protein